MSDAIVAGLYQAAELLIDDCYDKEENPVRIIEEGAAEITRLHARVLELRDALQSLVSVQNGPPLYTYTDSWNEAMAQAAAALDKE